MERPPIDVQLAKTEPNIDVIKFLKECQKTHTEWAEYFEKDPEIEAQYVGSGEWEDAAAHRQLEKQYNQVIQKYLSLEREKAKLEAKLKRIVALGHNNDCIFCGFKDKEASRD